MANNQVYLLTKPRNQSFYRNLMMWLTFLGLSDATWWGYDKPNKLVLFCGHIFPPFSPLGILSQIVFIVTHRNELNIEMVGVIFAIFPVSCIILVKLVSSYFKSYINLMKNFMDKIHLQNIKEQELVDDKTLIQVEKISRYTSYFLVTCIMIDWSSWVSTPIVTNIKNIELIRNETMPLSVFIYFWTPRRFEYKFNVRNWIFMHCVEAVLGWLGCSAVVSFTCVEYIFVYHFIGHIKALKKMITLKFKNQDVTKHEEISKNLVDVIKYHIFIKNLFKEIKDAFGLCVTATYVHNLIGDSLLLYQVMFAEKEALLSYGLMIILYMGSLILLSFVLEEIKNQSDELSIVLYDVPWENMSLRNKKTYLILFSQVQEPMQFLAAGNLRAGVEPMISIVKSTFSYYVMLKSCIK